MITIYGSRLIGFGSGLRISSNLPRILSVAVMLAVGRILEFWGVEIQAAVFGLCFGCRSMKIYAFIDPSVLYLIALGAIGIFALFQNHQANLICFFGVMLLLDLGSQANFYQSRPHSISLYLVSSSPPSLFYSEYLSSHLDL